MQNKSGLLDLTPNQSPEPTAEQKIGDRMRGHRNAELVS